RLAPLAGQDPLAVMAWRARQRRLRRLVIFEIVLGQELAVLAVVIRREELALIADDEAARTGNLPFLDNFRDFLKHVVAWLFAAVVPGELDRRQPVASREVETDDRPFRRAFRAQAGGLRLDSRRIAELQGHER